MGDSLCYEIMQVTFLHDLSTLCSVQSFFLNKLIEEFGPLCFYPSLIFTDESIVFSAHKILRQWERHLNGFLAYCTFGTPKGFCHKKSNKWIMYYFKSQPE